MCDEIPLTGGRMTQGVVRKGEYVLRLCCSNSAFVHDVLKWLEIKGVSAAPRFIGLTDDDREITTFLEGVSPTNLSAYKDDYQWRPSYSQLIEVGKIIKALHMALSDYPGCPDGQTVCHNDLSPCNFMFINDLPYAVFDWDAALIGDPLDDLAYAAWMWTDLGNDEITPVDIGLTIKTILDSYGLGSAQRSLLIVKMHEQIQRVRKSFSAANITPTTQWAYECDQRLYRIQNQVVTCFTS